MKPFAVIGMGNLLMSDEGIGVQVVSALEQCGVSDDVELLDLGTSWMSVVHELSGRQKVVVVDCALMGEVPGTLRRFLPEDVRSRKVQSSTSFHEGDLLNTLALSQRLGDYPEDVVLFGIEPQSVVPGQDLSPVHDAMMELYVFAVQQELEAFPCLTELK